MQPIIYKSTDTGAPQLSATAGAMNAVIKACLVTGYGSKAVAGWQVVYEDLATKKIAVRSVTPKSIGSVLLLDNTATDSASATAYLEWNSKTNTGVTQFGTGFFVNNWQTTTPNWVVVATDSFFYLFVQADAGNKAMRIMSAFGDINTLTASEGCSALLAAPGRSYDPASTGYTSVVTSRGVARFPRYLYERIDASYGWGDRASGFSSGAISSVAVLSRFPLYIMVEDKMQPVLELPGMLMPFSEIKGYGTDINNIESLSNQSPYVNPILGMYQPYHGRLWIHTDDWG